MKNLIALGYLFFLAGACAAPRENIKRATAYQDQHIWIISGNGIRSNAVHTIHEEPSTAYYADDDDDLDEDGQQMISLVEIDQGDANSNNDDYDDDDNSVNEDDENEEVAVSTDSIVGIIPFVQEKVLNKNYLQSVLSRNRGDSGALILSEGIDDLEGKETVGDKLGDTTLFVPRDTLTGIPDGSMVTLIDDTESLGRAKKVIIRRRRKGSKNNGKRRRRSGNKRKTNAVRVIRKKPSRRRNNRRRRVPNVIHI